MRTAASMARVAVLFLLFAASACASAPRAGNGEAEAPAQPVMLWVQNNHWSDVTIWVIAGGQRNRVGVVTAAQTREFVLRPPMLNHRGEIRLMANALADLRPVTTELIVVRSGSVVEWTLESQLRRSSLAVY